MKSRYAIAGLVLFVWTEAARAESGEGILYPQINIVSDNRYAGMSNNNGEPTLQASLYLWRPDGYYGGLWVTGVDYGYAGGPSWESDIYAGRNFDFGKTRLSLEAMASLFPDQSGPGPTLNFYQGTVKVKRTFGGGWVQQTASWSPEGAYSGGETWKTESSLSVALGKRIDVSANYGLFLSERKQDRKFWDFGVTANLKSVAFDVRYYDTDLERTQCFFSDWCEPSVVGKVTWNVPLFGFGGGKE